MSICIDLDKSFTTAESLNVYNEGELTVIDRGDEKFDGIMVGWSRMIEVAHDMPAFGVSINDLTLKELKHGLWVEFAFGEVYESNGMPYEKLLIKVEKDFYGFNLIRYTAESGYTGRCFYYDLVNKNMDDFYDLLLKI